MTDREKLIELLDQCDRCNAEYCNQCEFGKDIDGCVLRQKEIIADTLLANGVTFAADTNDGGKWIKADQPPEDWKGEGGYLTNYYVYTPEYGVDIGNYMKPADKWLCMGIPCNVTHWMPLPEPPAATLNRGQEL